MSSEPRIVSNFNYRVMAAYLRFRERFRKPDHMIESLGIGQGDFVLDFGCGIGSYAIPTAKRVGSSGRVYALDIHPMAIERVQKRVKKEGLTNIETILSGLETGLADESLDYILLFDVYTWIPNKRPLLKELSRILKSTGKMSVLIDHTNPEEFINDLRCYGFFNIEIQDDNFFTLSKK
ncbi:MAG: class I SAM-dependent methyltransferase [Candidatus Thorarchaeota archaeon]